ncbi:MAG: redoxin domain-containing protein [Bacteroidales bacterium]|jgi:thiol-disulfide isomerase/thioredoxin|nr:redoxin domain-containing protein [Bacteroidales bacterium]MCI2121795.1 redoxin domain-containing protein [Bacteroidales bacterium]MCI2146026.1 redoxin domain-containing protein [Bacteroidales bacterium]
MKKFATVIFAAAILLAAATVQSAAQNIYKGVGNYLRSLDGNEVPTIEAKVDRLVGACMDSTEAAKTAAFCYDYYLRSPIMGYESVALYIADNYFLNGKYEWPAAGGLVMLKLFAEFNRNSMIGCRAPVLKVFDINGKMLDMPDGKSVYKAAYFYDTGCSECKIQTPLLIKYLKSYSGIPLVFYAFYTQADSLSWKKAAAEFDSIANYYVTVVNVWDPNENSDFHKQYSVLSTPQLFLIDRQNTVVGRKLDCTALEQLIAKLDAKNREDEDFFMRFFDALKPLDDTIVNEAVDAFYEKTSPDSALFCNTFYELYRFMKDSNDYEIQKGAVYLAEKYIIGKSGMWPEDIVGQCSEAVELFKRNPLGETAQNLFLQDARGRNTTLLKGKAKAKAVYFFDFNCPVCEASTEDMKAMDNLFKKKGVQVTVVYVGTESKRFRKYAKNLPRKWRILHDGSGYSQMYEKYNLTSVPAIYLLEGNNEVMAKEINTTTLKKLVEGL